MTTNPYLTLDVEHVVDLEEVGILPHDCFQDVNGYVPMSAAAVRGCQWKTPIGSAAAYMARRNREIVAAARKAHAARRAARAA